MVTDTMRKSLSAVIALRGGFIAVAASSDRPMVIAGTTDELEGKGKYDGWRGKGEETEDFSIVRWK